MIDRSSLKMFCASALLASFGLAGCGGNTGNAGASPQPSASALPATDPVVQTPGDGIIIGSNWYPLEKYKGATFHWATNDAEVTACPNANAHTLALQLEPGPGINGTAAPTAHITITGNHGDTASAAIKGAQYVKVQVGHYPAETFVIHAQTENHSSPNGDKRILNYRILGAALGSSIDNCKRAIVKDGSPLVVGANWFAYETFDGQSYRWVKNDAQLKLTDALAKPTVLDLAVSPGPSLGGDPLKLTISDGHGHSIVGKEVVANGAYPTSFTFDLPAEPNGTVLTISTPTKDTAVTKDPRKYLNFRVFNASLR